MHLLKNSHLVVVLLLLASTSCYGQFGSAAFGTGVYFPELGNKVQFDTIYGSLSRWQLGFGIKNIPSALNPNKRTMLYRADTDYVSQAPCWVLDPSPVFNVHKFSTHKFNASIVPSMVIPYHFRSSKSVDLLSYDGSSGRLFIFWSDSNGEYSDSLKTELSFRSRYDSQAFVHGGMMTPYVFRDPSDTVDNIVWGTLAYDRQQTTERDSFVVGVYAGGIPLFLQGKQAYPDSSVVMMYVPNPTIHTFGDLRGAQGDFEGKGFDDYVVANYYGSVFLYRYQSPFTLTEFARALREDTIFTEWQNPMANTSVTNGTPFYSYHILSMRAFAKAPGDSSVDLIIPIERKDTQNASLYLFRGGKHFGTKRLFIDSADFRLHHPSYYDNFDFSLFPTNQQYVNCGDMTGSGNNVLCCSFGSVFNNVSANCFYVLGTALDDKVDMFFSQDNSGIVAGIDTLDANGDGLMDVLIGMPDYVSDRDAQSGLSSMGSMGVLYGSKNIPSLRVQPPSAVVDNNTLSLYPNPAREVLHLQCRSALATEATIEIHDMLGRLVYRAKQQIWVGTIELTIPISLSLTTGTYSVELLTPGYPKKQATVLIMQ